MSARPILWTMTALALGCSEPSGGQASGPASTEPGAAAPSAVLVEATPTAASPGSSSAASLPESREVSFTTDDGVTIHATLQPAAHPASPLVVLVHQHGGSRADWAPLLERLHQHGRIATLALDLRGHGESTLDRRGQPLSFRDFDRAAWARTGADVRAARAFVQAADSGLVPSRIGVVGASIGATAAVLAAAEDAALGPLVLLSPGRAYHGVDGITPAVGLTGRRLYTFAAERDGDVAETANTLARIGATTPTLVAGEAHGVALLGDDSTLEEVASLVERALYE